MGVNKVIYYGEVLVDMSQVTVTPESLEKGKTALDAKGELITGLHEGVEPNGDTLVWDGNTEGLDSIEFGIPMYRVSDLYPTLSEVNAGATLIFFEDYGATGVSQETAVAPSDAHSIADLSEMFGVEAWMFYVNNTTPLVVACSQDITADGVTVKKGVYFGGSLSDYGIQVKALTIANYTGFPCIATPANPELQEKTVTPSTSAQSVTADSGYDGLSKVTVNAMPTATQATPSISVSSAGKITASSTQTAGYVAAGTKSATKQLTTQAAKTVTPTTSSQTAVASGRYTTGAVTVAGDANLVPANIVSGKSIFGVAGSASTSEDLTAEITEYAELNAELESVINGLPSAGGSGDGSVEFGYFSVDGWEEPSWYETYKIPFMIGQTWDDWLSTALNISVFTSVGMVQLSESNGEIKGTASTGLRGSLSTSYATEGIVSPSDVIQNESIYYLVVSGGGFE